MHLHAPITFYMHSKLNKSSAIVSLIKLYTFNTFMKMHLNPDFHNTCITIYIKVGFGFL